MACIGKTKIMLAKLREKVPNPIRNFVSHLFTTKSIDDLEGDSDDKSMKKSLTAVDVTLLGIGAIIGAGIFVLTGQAAGKNAGPAIVISFMIAGVAAGLAALCYAEMASMLPVAGSAYTYSYATMGELLAWTIGWDLILEYLVGSAAVSVSWSSYVVAFLEDVGAGRIIHHEWTTAPFSFNDTTNAFSSTGAYINAPAMIIVLLIMVLLVVGIKESARFNAMAVFVKITVVLIIIFGSIKWIEPSNWQPFVPPRGNSFGRYGVGGIFQATTMCFFAYIGFDAVSTTAQECRNPQRDLPIGILASLLIATVLYMAVCLCMTGLIPYELLEDVAHPLAKAAEYVGQSWMAIVAEVGAIFGLMSVMVVMLMSQPRVFYSMARDGLLPPCFARLHPRFGTPVFPTILTGLVGATLGGLLPISVLGELTSVGTLLAFLLVSLGVMILRITRPDLPRKFRVPLGPYLIPLLSAASSLTLICVSTVQTIIRLFVWMAIGYVIYFAYGIRRSKLRQKRNMASTSEAVNGVEMKQSEPGPEPPAYHDVIDDNSNHIATTSAVPVESSSLKHVGSVGLVDGSHGMEAEARGPFVTIHNVIAVGNADAKLHSSRHSDISGRWKSALLRAD